MSSATEPLGPSVPSPSRVPATDGESADQLPVRALLAGSDVPVGLFRYDVLSQTWWWSDSMLAIHGFEPGEVVPTTELFLAHKHPDDLAHATGTMDQALLDGQPFSCRHRIIDAAGGTRRVVSIGEGVIADGKVVAIRGYFLDVTASVAQDVRHEIHEAIARSAATRGVIEQAKGALMACYGSTQDEAFRLLCGYSQNHNIRVSALAAHIVEQLSTPPYSRLPAPGNIGAILAAVSDDPSIVTRMSKDRTR